MWQYYTLGKLTHYLADAFTYPHNDNYPESLLEHRRYEDDLRVYFAEYLHKRAIHRQQSREDLISALRELHDQYMDNLSDLHRDIRYICKATSLLMENCQPVAA